MRRLAELSRDQLWKITDTTLIERLAKPQFVQLNDKSFNFILIQSDSDVRDG